ncbi:hypothetical protein MPSEU_000848300 [Mayamaea pseudoterrestris]|nr:hypothetical protein MPSEU_000848300 [Mayamaea pseudoterrestris]
MMKLQAISTLLLLWLYGAEGRGSLRGSSSDRRRLETASANLPPFSIQFTSLVTSDSDLDRINSPLSLIAGEFLAESFDEALSMPTNDVRLLWLRQNYVTLRVSISDLSSKSISPSKQRITAVFQGQVMLRNGTYSSENKLSDKEIYYVAQSVLLQTFTEDRKFLQQYMKDSANIVIQKHSFLSLQVGDAALGLINLDSEKTGMEQPILLTTVLLVGLVGMIPLFLLVKKNHIITNIHKKWVHRNDNSYSTTVLAGRESDDTDNDESEASAVANKVLQASDQYLSRHRPDLMDKTSPGLSPATAATSPSSSNVSPSSPAAKIISVSGWLKHTLLRRRAGQCGTGDGLVRGKDASKYDFAFQDWSRHDGTPIWKYSDSKEGDEQSPEGYADEFFRRNLQASFDREQLSRDDDEFSQNDAEVFMDKLEGLFERKHQHYQENRMQHDKKYRIEEEARKRDLQLRRHEMELDLSAIEAEFSPRKTLPPKPMQRQRIHQPEISNDTGSAALPGHRVTRSKSSMSAVGKIAQRFGGAKAKMTTIGDSMMGKPKRAGLVRSSSQGSLQAMAPPLPPTSGSKRNGTATSTSPSLNASISRGRTAAPGRRSRRSHSHGTNERRRRAQESGAPVDDVMTFGIAAYSKLA